MILIDGAKFEFIELAAMNLKNELDSSNGDRSASRGAKGENAMQFNNNAASIGIVCVASLAVPITARAVVIDDYSVEPLSFSSVNNSVSQITQTNLDPAHVINGTRDVRFFFVGSAGNTMTIDASTGLLTVPKAATCCTELTVTYGFPTALDLNLLADGANQFVFKFGPIDPTAAYVIPSFVLTDSQNHQAYPLRNSILPPNPQNGFSLTVPFSQILGVNLSNVQSIRVDIGRYPGGSSFSLDDIRTVPEPASATLLVLFVVTATFSESGRYRRIRG